MEFEKSLVLKELEELKRSGCIYLLGTEPTCFESKNSEKSLTIRNQANQLFAKKNHNESIHEELWKLYTKSIAYAEKESNELPAGYANRSALLLHLKKYHDCLIDIDRALKVTKSNALKVKLYCRQSECNMTIQNGKEKASLEKAKFWLNKIDDVKEKNQLQKKIEKTENIIDKADIISSKKKDKVCELSCDNDALCINYSVKYGKHLVANRDIQLGELIYIDKFYVVTINTAKFYAYCSHCLAISWSTIPCDNCSFYLYCSEKCKEEAWQKYHDIECTVEFGKHPRDHFDYYVQLGLRALIMGFKETGSIAKLRDLTNEINKCTDLGKRGLTKNGKFSSNSFRSLYSLSCSKNVSKLTRCIPEILKILVALAKYTDIFGEFKYTNNLDLMKNESAIFVACLFTRLSSIGLVNAFELASANGDCSKSNNFIDCVKNFCCSRGLNISLFTSLINHSCDNNVDKFYTNDGRVAYYAVQPIGKNSQIFSSYYCRFFKMPKIFRQKVLSTEFEFRCDCIACTCDWQRLQEKSLYDRDYIDLENAILMRNLKALKKSTNVGLQRGKRCSNKVIRTFIEDTQVLMKYSKRPAFLTDYFIWKFSLMIEGRYFAKLQVPSSCK